MHERIFDEMRNIVVSGGSGAIGAAFIAALARKHPRAFIHNLSRTPWTCSNAWIQPIAVDHTDENSLRDAARAVARRGDLDLVVVAGGLLHSEALMPEKSLRDLDAGKMCNVLCANTIAPTLLAKHFLPLLARDRRAVFAALSARVGSISDNHLGGWYSYRASKAALNMIVRTASIEVRRRNPRAIVATLHPGTVDSALSRPFQGSVAPENLFSPEFSVARMIDVIEHLDISDSGHCFAWDGSRIKP